MDGQAVPVATNGAMARVEPRQDRSGVDGGRDTWDGQGFIPNCEDRASTSDSASTRRQVLQYPEFISRVLWFFRFVAKTCVETVPEYLELGGLFSLCVWREQSTPQTGVLQVLVIRKACDCKDMWPVPGTENRVLAGYSRVL
jgi:hypothetical protein